MSEILTLRDAAQALAQLDISGEGLISVFDRSTMTMEVSFDYGVYPHAPNSYGDPEAIADPFSRLFRNLFAQYPELGGIGLVRSYYVQLWASLGGEVPPLNAYHAEHFYGAVPCTARHLEYIDDLAETLFTDVTNVICHKDYIACPAVLLQGIGGLVFGKTAADVVANAAFLENVVHTAWDLTSKKARPAYLGYSFMDHFRKMRGL
jgi:L-ribulose-5-phosphate 4-epimerase